MFCTRQILTLLEYLKAHTDEEHQLTQVELIKRLTELGFPKERKSVDTAFENLTKAAVDATVQTDSESM